MLNSKIKLKTQNPFKGFGLLANQTIAQPNGLSYIGTAIDLKDLAAFIDFQKKQGIFNFFFEKDLKYDFADVPTYYRNFNILGKLKNIEEVLLIGTFPRYEASILNVYIRKIFNKFKTKIYTISNWNENNYEISQLGNSVRTTLDILKGKHFLLKDLVNSKSLMITTSLNHFTSKYETNNFYLNKILVKKHYLNYNSNNVLNIVSPNLSNFIAKEFLFFNNSKSLKLYDNFEINKKLLKTNNIFGLNIQENNFDKNLVSNLKNKKASLNLFSTHNWNFNKIENENQLYIPIQNFFEKDNFVLNIDGKIQKSSKVTSIQNNKIKNLNNFIENFFYYNDEKSFSYDRNSLKKIWNNSLGVLEDKRIINTSNFFKNFSKYSTSYLENNFIQNFTSFYKKKNLFDFYNLTNLVKFKKKTIRLYTYTNQVKNFYQTDLLSNSSYVMSLTTLFNELNTPFKVIQGPNLKNNTLKQTYFSIEKK